MNFAELPELLRRTTVTLISKCGGMFGIGVLRLLPEAARLRPAFPTPALGPRRCVASLRLGFLRLRTTLRGTKRATDGVNFRHAARAATALILPVGLVRAAVCLRCR